MRKILITGANSYIGSNLENLLKNNDDYSVAVRDTMNWEPQVSDFEGYDVVFNVAGIAHIKETKQNESLYYKVNRDLAVKIAEVAKKSGIRQYIVLSSMAVYGVEEGTINKNTSPNPQTAYGKSKLEADIEIKKLEDDSFAFTCVRPPMVYGRGCKGNYQLLRKLAVKTPIFPDFNNQRSMIYIDNLCMFIKDCIDQRKSGLFHPQNAEYVCTSEMVKNIAECNHKKIRTTKLFNWVLGIVDFKIFKKVFGSLTYEKEDVVTKYNFEESIRMTEQ